MGGKHSMGKGKIKDETEKLKEKDEKVKAKDRALTAVLSYLSSKIERQEAQLIAEAAPTFQTNNEPKPDEQQPYQVWKTCEILHEKPRIDHLDEWMRIWAIPQETRNAEVAKSVSQADYQ